MINQWGSTRTSEKSAAKLSSLRSDKFLGFATFIGVILVSSDSSDHVGKRKGSIDQNRILTYQIASFNSATSCGCTAQLQPLPPAARDAQARIHYCTSFRNCTLPGKNTDIELWPVATIVQNKCRYELREFIATLQRVRVFSLPAISS